MRKGYAFVVGLILLAAARPAPAHHAFTAEFDPKKPVSLTGTVAKLEWTNPHVWLYIDVKDDAGTVTSWALELGSPNALTRSGWTRTSVKIGDAITVEGSGAKNGSNNASANAVMLNGRRLYGGSNESASENRQ